jgi:hypothetical protein
LRIGPLFDGAKIPPEVLSPAGVAHVNKIIEDLRGRLVDSIQLAEPASGFRLSNMVRSYTQAHLRRSLMFIEAAHDEFFAGRGMVALSCVRSIFENVAVYCDFERQLQPLLTAGDIAKFEEGDIEEIHEFVRSKAFATRKAHLIQHADTTSVSATNILTLIDKMKPLRESYRDDYDHLCELAHPNALGAVVYFQSLDDRTDTLRYSDRGPAPDEDLKWVLIGAYTLELFDQAIARIEANLPALSARGAELSPKKSGV